MTHKKILIIDDDQSIIYSIEKTLKNLPYELHVASNGNTALELLKDLTPHLILLDLSMPIMNGIEFLKAIDLKPKDPYAVIVLTGHGDDEEMCQCYELGAHFFFRKPFGIMDLRCLVERCLTFKEIEYEAFQYRRYLEDSVESQNSYINKLSVAIDQSATSIIMSDEQCKVTYLNNSYSNISGFTLNDLKGKNFFSTFAPDSSIELEDVKNHIENGSSWKGELQSLRKNGESYWVSSAINTIKDSKGKITNYILIQDDLTLQKEAENAKMHSIELLEQHRRHKQNFSDNMSHEILTPIHIISTAISIFDSLDLEESHKKYIEYIRSSVNDLISLTSMILSMKRIDSGLIKPQLRPISLPSMFADISKVYLPKATEKSLAFTCHVHKEVADPINTDPMLLYQLLTYLVDNAIKFTHSGNITLTANYDSTVNHLIIEVEDTGIGIHESKLEMIFDSYQQADASNSRAYNGIGLGLTLSQNITHILGGEINVISSEGKGSIFRINLPLATSGALQ